MRMNPLRLIFAVAIALLLIATSVVSAADTAATTTALAWPAGLPVYDHVVIVIEENKDYGEIIGSRHAPYINQLRAEGANLTQMFGEEHYSQGNYFWLFSGSNQNVGFFDQIPSSPITAANLGAELFTKGLTFGGYSEDLPATGALVDWAKNAAGKKSYARKHVPWASFAFPPKNQLSGSANMPFTDFPRAEADFAKLPTIAIVVPGLKDDMHDGLPRHSIPKGDEWLREHINAYYQWAKSHNSVLIVTWDENDNQYDKRHPAGITVPGLTNPFESTKTAKGRSIQNRIATILAGAHIKPGDYAEGNGVTHVNLLRTLEAMYGLPRAGAQQPNALKGGIRDDYIITDIFK
jgi:phosphatidylinositol-3-phosphatase